MTWFPLLLYLSLAFLLLLREILFEDPNARAIIRVAFDKRVVNQDADGNPAIGVGVCQVAADQMMTAVVPAGHRAFAAHRRIQTQKTTAGIAGNAMLHLDDFRN